MPTYRVWYRDIPEPLAFTAPNRCSDLEIVEQILAHENIVSSAAAQTAKELIDKNHLAPVRYTEDESELNVIE
jgi:hypothetical protein